MSYYQKAVIQMLKTGTVDGSLNWKYTRPSLWTCEIHDNIDCKIGTNQYKFTNIKMTATVDSIGIMISFPESGINQDNNDTNGKVLFVTHDNDTIRLFDMLANKLKNEHRPSYKDWHSIYDILIDSGIKNYCKCQACGNEYTSPDSDYCTKCGSLL